ncbi:hypothetical protein ABPG75_005117 [Micractinium tetrahymenae]
MQMLSGLIGTGLYDWSLALRARLSPAFSGPEAATQLGTLAVLLLLCCGLPAAAPAAFRRHRCAVLGLARLAFTLQPDFCSERSIVTVLDASPPSPRPLGVLRDLLRLSVGSRSLGMFLASVLCPLPLVPHLALTALALQRCRRTAFMCGRPLLQHPIWQQRIHWVHLAAREVRLPAAAACFRPLACHIARSTTVGVALFPAPRNPALLAASLSRAACLVV